MLAIKAGNLVDTLNARIIKDQIILLENDRIAAVQPQKDFDSSSVTELVDFSGFYVMPGLVDCHIHINFTALADSRMSKYDAEATHAYHAAANAMTYLKSGFTTVRSLGSKFDVDIKLRNAINAGILPGPRILASGRNLTITGGHGNDGGIEADGPWEVRKAARTVLKAGADIIKVMATGGVLTEGAEPGTPEFSLEELEAVAIEAHRVGKKASTHAHGNTGIRNAVKAGIDTIEHGVFLDDEIIEMMLKKGTALVPTLCAPYNINRYGVEAGIPQYMVDKSLRIAEHHFNNFYKAYKAGVLIGMGTDAGTPLNRHGENALELELMVEAGMSVEDAIRAVSSGAAKVLGMEDTIGRITPGFQADLLVLDGNPFENIAILHDKSRIHSLIMGGKIINTEF